MKSFSEIETIAKRASRAVGFSWGIGEEIGKNIRLLELFGFPGIKNLNKYFKVYNNKKFQNISLISKSNTSKILYCPISVGINFLDQISIMEELEEIEFDNVAFPILLVPFFSRASEIIGKKIHLQIDEISFLLNYNQSIQCNHSVKDSIEKSNKINIKFLENQNLFNEQEWEELYKIAENTFVEETNELKEKGAGAGLTDND